MRAAFTKFAKPIVAGTLSLLAFGVHYVTRWDPSPDPAPIHSSNPLIHCSTESPMRVSSNDQESVWRIAVVTNRDLSSSGVRHSIPPAGSSLFEQTQFAQGETGATTYGLCDVELPCDRDRGSCEVGRARDKVHVGSLHRLDSKAFIQNLSTTLAENDNPNVLVFVHGFNVSFENSIARAAQLANDMPFGGVIVGFSWASCGGEEGMMVNDRYARDEQIAERYFWSLGRLLVQLREGLPQNARIHLLAHSMGNRVALRALNALAGRLSPTGSRVFMEQKELAKAYPLWSRWNPTQLKKPILSDIVFAAPDVEANEFRTLVTNISHIAQHMTLYASDVDVALEGSLKYNGEGYRAGDTRARISIPGLRVVHTSRVSRLDPLGHSYYGSDPQVLNNLAILFQTDGEALKKMTLAEFGRKLTRQ